MITLSIRGWCYFNSQGFVKPWPHLWCEAENRPTFYEARLLTIFMVVHGLIDVYQRLWTFYERRPMVVHGFSIFDAFWCFLSVFAVEKPMRCPSVPTSQPPRHQLVKSLWFGETTMFGEISFHPSNGWSLLILIDPDWSWNPRFSQLWNFTLLQSQLFVDTKATSTYLNSIGCLGDLKSRSLPRLRIVHRESLGNKFIPQVRSNFTLHSPLGGSAP